MLFLHPTEIGFVHAPDQRLEPFEIVYVAAPKSLGVTVHRHEGDATTPAVCPELPISRERPEGAPDAFEVLREVGAIAQRLGSETMLFSDLGEPFGLIAPL